MALLEVENLKKRFGNNEVLKGISFSLDKGQTMSVIGPSGGGKTTFLRCLNFLEMPDEGIIRVNQETIFDASQSRNLSENELRANRLHFGLVFQDFNLFPQYTALGNVSLALSGAGVLLFTVSLQPYASVLLFIFLAVKALLLVKKP